jgi:hypothetical protein
LLGRLSQLVATRDDRSAAAVVRADAAPMCAGAIGKLRSPEEHASQLVEWLCNKGLGGNCLLSTDLVRHHREMCTELGLYARPWNPIGHALAVLTTGGSGKKLYAHVNGRRLRVYALPSATARHIEVEEPRVSQDSRVAA